MSTLRGPRRPVLEIDPRLLLRAQPVRVAFFDVDGVLTDGGLYFSEHGGASDDSAPYGARKAGLSRPLITTGVMPARCNNFKP